MCGIIGSFANQEKINKELFFSAMKNLDHRGPDNTGLEEGIIKDFSFIIGHKRLSILDLSERGNQPFKSDNNRFLLSYNGEIYNFMELKKELTNVGFNFNTNCDTEVLLNAWMYWGVESINKFKGMFAFAILDKYKRNLYLVRDGFGIKPIFYALNPERTKLVFSSEINSLKNLIGSKIFLNNKKAFEYLNYGLYDHEEETFIKDIYSVKQGHLIEFNFKDVINYKKKKWWNPKFETNADITFNEAKNEVKKRFLNNIKLHLRSDVEIGTALSGGIDSSAITSCIRYLNPEMKINTYNFSSESKNNDESKWANLLSKKIKTNNQTLKISGEEFKEDIEKLVILQGEPFGSTSIYAQYRLFQRIKQDNIKVILDGQGGDEVLGGYDGYPEEIIKNLIFKKDFLKIPIFLKNLKTNQDLSNKKLLTLFAKGILPRKLLNNISKSKKRNEFDWINFNDLNQDSNEINYFKIDELLKYFNGKNNLRNTLYRSIDSFGLSSLLRHEDRNSMANNIESRVPFLTTDFAEFLLSLPEEYLVSNSGETKSIFRESMKGIVPQRILGRKDKIGFATPEFKLVKSLINNIDEYIDIAKDIPFIKYEKTKTFLNYLTSSEENFDWICWRIINLCYWMKLLNIDLIT